MAYRGLGGSGCRSGQPAAYVPDRPGYGESPSQNLKEYDPEWGRAFVNGTVAAICDHERMLSAVNVPVLLTHHFRLVDADRGRLMGAMSDVQAARVRELVQGAGQRLEYQSFPDMGHSMHGQDPALFCRMLVEWHRSLAPAT